MFFVFAAFGMSVLEIVRLALAERGVGLLPATPAAMLLILSLLWFERNGRTHAISVVSVVTLIDAD